MTVTIHLEAETEAKLREQAARRGANLEDYLTQLAQDWAIANSAATSNLKSRDERETEWRAWAASHPPLSYVADDSRESIYAGRGE